jgi:acyl-coenzyme A thioesterase PaaI-like protein
LRVEVHFDGHCFGCGPLNQDGLQMVFTPGLDGSSCELALPERFQSWAGMAHGGIVSLMLDEAVGWAAWHAGHPGVTGRLAVSLRRPLRLRERVRVVGQVERVRRSLVYTVAFIDSLEDGDRIADATATLMMTETKVDVPAR